MIPIALIALAVAAVVSGQDCEHTSCNTGLVKYYTELGCLPVKEPGACCASKFDCNSALSNRAADKCHLKGRSYDKDATLTTEQVGDKCIAECRCSKHGSEANLRCVTIECPELFNGPPPPGCTRLYSHDLCCSTGYHCNNATQPAAKKAFTCAHNGKSYVVGEKFYPEEKSCMTCICQEGYDGTLREPWCTEVNCGIEIHYGSKIREGCAPIHFGKSGCCPIGWRCPEESDSVLSDTAAASTKDTAQCSFGRLSLKVAEKLNSDKTCVECKCNVPPHISCVQTGYC